MKKFLCICEAGCVRSVAMAGALKMTGDQDAVAASWRWNSKETLAQLADWADYIILMQKWDPNSFLPERAHSKVRVVDVGPDNFGSAFHRDLFPRLVKQVQDWADKDFVL